MSRQEKGSRMRLLPAKLQLQQRDALTGSYPTNQRFSTDGRTGNYLTNFDDTKTIDFISVESEVLVTEQTYGFESDLIHYQRWSDDEYQGALQTELRFKQTYVGTPFSTEINQAIQDINNNDKNDDNLMIVQMAQFDSNPWPKPGPHPNTKALLFDKDNAEFAYIDYYQTDPGANYKDVTNRPFSVCVWIYPTIEDKEVEYPIVYQGMLNAAESIISPQSVWQLLIVDQRIEFRVYNEGIYNQYAYARTIDQIPSGEWIQVCVTYNPDGGNKAIFIYVNKAEQQLDTNYDAFTNGLICQYEQLVIGRYYYNDEVNPVIDNKYLGLISEIFYTGKRLSEEEIEILDDAVRSGVSIIDYAESSTENVGGYIPGIGLSKSSIWLQQPDAQDILSLTGSSMYSATGSVQPSVIDGLPFIHFSPGQDLTPFRDSSHPAVDGKSDNNPFYATGSAVTDVGEGFTSPLWSKNKIEIDISVAGECDILYQLGNDEAMHETGSNPSFLMAYYNFDSNLWEGLGDGVAITDETFRSGSSLLDKQITAGFTPSLGIPWWSENNPNNEDGTGVSGSGYNLLHLAGVPFRDFGFPYDARYHATSSQTLNIRNYIQEPFLLEKIVLEISATFYSTVDGIVNDSVLTPGANDLPVSKSPISTRQLTAGDPSVNAFSGSWIPCNINTFFMLNQKREQKFSTNTLFSISDNGLSTSTIPTSIGAPGSRRISTRNELITYLNILTYNSATNIDSKVSSNTYKINEPTLLENTSSFDNFFLSDNIDFIQIDDCTQRNFTGNIGFWPNSTLVVSGTCKTPMIFNQVSVSGNLLPAPSYTEIFRSSITYGVSAFLRQPSGFETQILSAMSPKGILEFESDLDYGNTGTRTGLGMSHVTNRDYVSPFKIAPVGVPRPNAYHGSFNNFSITEPKYTGATFHTTFPALVYRDAVAYNNPYILFPEDQLVFGWQLPMMMASVHNTNNVKVSYGIKFLPGPAKITLYGSYIREGREYNEGTNQLLSSDSIHEVIE